MGSWYYIVDGEFAAYALKIYITLERIDEELRPYDKPRFLLMLAKKLELRF